jgi:hypothetical protein
MAPTTVTLQAAQKIETAMTGNQTASPSPILAFHPRTHQEPWDYTLTLQYIINISGGTYTVRGHVHFTHTGGTNFSKGPGYYWISGLDKWERRTPGWVVTSAPTISLTQRTTAVNTFNSKHGTSHAVV